MDQEYIEDIAEELAYLVEESGKDLARYQNGSITEEHLLTTTEKALGKYVSLVDEVTKAVDSLGDINIAEEIREGLESSGYRNLEEVAAGRKPIRASGENSVRSVINSLETGSELGRAFQVVEDFDYLMADIRDRYNIDASYPDFEEAADEEMDIMEEASELEQQVIPVDETLKDLDPL